MLPLVLPQRTRPLSANWAFGLAAAHVGWHDFLQLMEAIRVLG